MRIVNAKIGSPIHIGRQGENLATKVVFNIDDWINTYGDSNNIELVANIDEQIIIVEVTKNGNEVVWEVKNDITQFTGHHICELFYTVNSALVKSRIYNFVVDQAIDSTEGTEAPEYANTWVTEVIDAKKEAIDAKKVAVEAKDDAVAAKDDAEAAQLAAKNAQEQAELARDSAKEFQDGAFNASNVANRMAVLAKNWAIGNTDVEHPEYEDPSDSNNSRYYALQAASSSTSAGDSATLAGEQADAAKMSANNARAYAVGGYYQYKDENGNISSTYVDGAKTYANATAATKAEIDGIKTEIDETKIAIDETKIAIDGMEADINDKTQKVGAAWTDIQARQADINSKAITISEQAATISEQAEIITEQVKSASDSAIAASKTLTTINIAKGQVDESRDQAAESARIASSAASEVASYSTNPPRIGLKEKGEDPDYWYIWQYNEETQTGKYVQTDSKVKFSIVAVYETENDMNADTSREVGDFVIVSKYDDGRDAVLYVYNGSAWTKITDLTGYEGVGIANIEYPESYGKPGTDDIYTIQLTNGKEYSFTVHNGYDGEGRGDMMASEYDPTGAIKDAGGIEQYVENAATKAILRTWTAADI